MRNKLSDILAKEPKFRYRQVYKLVYQDFIESWQEASVLPKPLREKLNRDCPLMIKAEEHKLKDGCIKAVITLRDGKKAEAVLIKNIDGRYTVCVSSQIGCPLACGFCATGAMGFVRNLSEVEIIEQVLYFARHLKKQGKKIDNVVYMGMGEPLLNIDQVLASIKILNDKEKFNLDARKISISTVGLKEGIEKIIKSGLQINLAISLHASNNKLRDRLMPVNKNMPIEKLLGLVDHYIVKTNRQVMFEYVLIGGVNDSREDAINLAKLMNKKLYMVNLIKYNPIGRFRAAGNDKMNEFKNILARNKVRVTARNSRGQEIKAACGQLSGK